MGSRSTSPTRCSCGTRTHSRRRWSRQGRRPRLDKAGFQLFVRQLELHLQGKSTLLIGDGASAHTAQDWRQYGLAWQRLPGAQSAVERFFEELRKETDNRVFTDLNQIERLLESLVRDYIHQPQKVKQLTLYPYMAQVA